jgi:catechol 2,3-dioxygenase-like lactoylglutathione lyase family enzyme
VEWRLELVLVPVADVDRAKTFYRDQIGFNEDLDTQLSDDVRLVQLTPPGSGCSIALMTGLAPGPGLESMVPGSLNGLQMVVSDINAARAQLIERGVEVSEPLEVVQEGGKFIYRTITGEPEGWNAFAYFNDPDGNGWILQQTPPGHN